MNKLTHSLIIAAAALSISGCSTTKLESTFKENAIASQQLTSSFQRQNTVVEWECQYATNIAGVKVGECVKTGIRSIQTTGYATAFGNSTHQRDIAFQVAHDLALDRLIRFVRQEVTSSRVISTLNKNVEKSNARVAKNEETSVVSTSDTETQPQNQNHYTNENTNSMVRELTETIRSQAQGIVRGARIVDQRVVDGKTVAVTIRWESDIDRILSQQRARFAN